MELYLLRHGAAEDRSLSGPDRARKLTVEGASAVRGTLQHAVTLGVRPAVILSSPYERAIETAHIAAEIFGCEGPVLRSRALEPDASPAGLWDEVRLQGDAPAVLVVSHEPLLSSTVAWLSGSAQVLSSFGAGTLARVDIESAGAVPRAVTRWLPGRWGLLD